MPFQSVSPEARTSGASEISSDDDSTSSDELLTLTPRQNGSLTAFQPIDSPVLTRSPRPGSMHSTASNSSSPRRGRGILKGTGPELQPGAARRARPGVTYNIKELSYKTRTLSKSSPKKTSLKSHVTNPEGPSSRRHRSEPPTYNLQELIRQATGVSQPPSKLATYLKKHENKQKRQVEPAKRAAGGDDADDPRPAKRRRHEKDSSHDPNMLDAVQSTRRNLQSTGVSTLIKHLNPILRNGKVSNPRAILISNPFNRNLLALPQQRAVEWNLSRIAINPWMFRSNIDITALLMQVTGDLAPEACTNCRDGRGLFTSCVLISTKTDSGNIYGCANCVYHGKQSKCSYRTWSREGPIKKGSQKHLLEHKRQAKENHQISPDHGVEPEESQSVTDDTAESVTHSDAVNRRVTTEEAITRFTTKDATIVTVGRPAELLHMEPWEKAPGRIRSKGSDSVDSESTIFFLYKTLLIS